MAGNTKPIGVHPPVLSDLEILIATRNAGGVYLTLSGSIKIFSPDLPGTMEGPIVFKVTLGSDFLTPDVEYIGNTEEMTSDARRFLVSCLNPQVEQVIGVRELYDKYMMAAGLATRRVFHEVLRTEFSAFLIPESGEYAVGERMIVKGYIVK